MKIHKRLNFIARAGWVLIVLFACKTSPALPTPLPSPIPPTETPQTGPFTEIFDDAQLACDRAENTLSVFGPLQTPVMGLIQGTGLNPGDWLYQPLESDNHEVVASDTDSVRTLACIRQELIKSVTYTYTDGTNAYDNVWIVKFVSWPNGKPLSKTEIRFVGYAPGSKPVGVDGIGQPPIEKLIEFLQDANRSQLMFVGEGNTQVSFSADGSLMAAAHENGQVFLWELAGRKILNQFSTSQRVSRIAISSDGSKVALETSGSLGTTQVFETSSGKLLYSLGAGKPVFSPDGQFLAVANPELKDEAGENDYASEIWIVDPETGAVLSKLEHSSKHVVFAMTFTHDSQWLIEDGGVMVYPQPNQPEIEGSLNVWNIEKRTLAFTLDDPIATSAWIEKISSSPDMPLVAFFSFKQGFHIWNFETGKVVQSLPNTDIFYGQVFSPDGHFLAVNTDDPGERYGCCSYLLDLSNYKNKVRLHDFNNLDIAFSTLAFDQKLNKVYMVSADGVMVTVNHVP